MTPVEVMAKRIRELEAEVLRLKRGDFTPEEFQNLCHNRHERPGRTRDEFVRGCDEFAHKLFGLPGGPPPMKSHERPNESDGSGLAELQRWESEGGKHDA